jgi:SAM-dependent methyltransferase
MRPISPDTPGGDAPPLEQQKQFWDEWNHTWRFGKRDSFMDRQRECLLEFAQALGLQDALILDVGCGTGWLGNTLSPFGRVWGTDLSEEAIFEGRRRHPDMQFVIGDFLTLDLPSYFDFVLSADSLNNMYDQPACVRRMATLLVPGGFLLLMSPNREVWRRRSALKPVGRGQVQRWPSLREYLDLLEPFFAIERVTTIDPGGDRGLLWWVENRYVRHAMSALVGRRHWRSMLEKARLGRDLVVLARRK